ncbi:hypothetical protein [Actinoplanes couchii]|uniref:HIT domain-containing protein n=1 Tax=Actinoplanes couchii TaxID=403638 RepID=A0ABQ3X491_9ACTN|nr:hypothetical protein [Actinoplanes couchii]MDR6326428.1 diadenosine tetraphosphate (Ap4A) HIT family hydrolase [Actinoplanes couchii]GID53220.1 hypothetical protein Aco03nite_016240 [Actinoplanes couchii]
MRVDGCAWCGERRDETAFGTRVWSGRVSDAYFARRGRVMVVWRGRHVVEPVDLSPVESDLYHREVLTVARAIRDCFRPDRLNFLTVADEEPHLHTLIETRYPGGVGDPRVDAAALHASLM